MFFHMLNKTYNAVGLKCSSRKVIFYIQMQQTERTNQPIGFAKWIKRFGVAGFLFFFIKGLLWLIVPAVLIWFGFTWD